MAWSKDRANRARWSRDQQEAARAAFAASLPSVEQQSAAKLATLREMAIAMVGQPHMAGTLEAVRAEIARLEG